MNMQARAAVDNQPTGEGQATPSPEHILQVGMGFWASKTLLSAVELDLFTLLAQSPMDAAAIERRLALHPRGTADFLDALVALGFLERDGDGASAVYRNAPETGLFLDRRSPRYVGGMLEMANARLYRFWGDLTEGLRTGKPQNEIKHSGRPFFAELYADGGRLAQFIDAMAGISAPNFEALARRFDFSRFSSVADIGGAGGHLSISLARSHPHLRCTSFDLPAVTPIARSRIEASGLADRVRAESLDFLAQPFPAADVVTMSLVLHDWDLATKKRLIAKAREALPPGGALIAIDHLIDDERRRNAFGLLMSLNMLIEVGEGFDYSAAQFRGWCLDAGYREVTVIPLAGPASAAVAYR